ncbi:MAG: peptidoglycan DD-metalloendopeptidase family protein, partial [Oscillospiraceae bacterium]|nr:peptidoglycan DD-metalloendopeptidase family protein [Oscillospiraceae bacterium]
MPKAKFSRQPTADSRQIKPKKQKAGGGGRKVGQAMLIVFVAFLLVFGGLLAANFQIGYEVRVNGQSVGVASDIANLDLIINDIETIVGAAADGESSFELNTQTEQKFIKKGDTDEIFEIRQNILALCPNVEQAYAIYVNDGLVCATRTQSDAFDALNSVKEQYNSGTLLKIEFVDEAKLRYEFVPQNQIMDLAEAKNTLNGKKRHRKVYDVTAEEELANIAQRFSMSLDELSEMNKNLGELVPAGSKVNILETQSNIQVRTEKIEEYEKEISYATEEVGDNVLPLGSRVLDSPGKSGVSIEKGTVIRINGLEQDRILISEEVKTQPVNEIIKIGLNDNGEKPIISNTSWIWPISGALSSGFSASRAHPIYGVTRPHEGIDLSASYGASIRASASGKVTLAAWSGDYGNCIRIKSDDTYSEVYAHLSQILVKEGQEVRQGQIIGKVGSTGASTGPHLHFEIRKNNVAVNPTTLLP